MNATQIKINNRYEIKLGKNTTQVTVASFDEENGTWLCETANGKALRIKESERFLKEVGTKVSPRDQRDTVGSQPVLPDQDDTAVPVADTYVKKARGPKPLGDMSAMSAAHRVLVEEGRPMQIREIMDTALSKGYCKLNGRTIFNTFNGGIRKEISKKGENSRFIKVGKGLFAAR